MGGIDLLATLTIKLAKSQARGHSSGCHSMSTSCIQLCSFSAFYVLGPTPGDLQVWSLNLITTLTAVINAILEMRTLRLREVKDLTQVTQPGRWDESACALWTASMVAALANHAPSEGGQIFGVHLMVT